MDLSPTVLAPMSQEVDANAGSLPSEAKTNTNNELSDSIETGSSLDAQEQKPLDLTFFCKAGNFHFYNESISQCKEAFCGIL